AAPALAHDADSLADADVHTDVLDSTNLTGPAAEHLRHLVRSHQRAGRAAGAVDVTGRHGRPPLASTPPLGRRRSGSTPARPDTAAAPLGHSADGRGIRVAGSPGPAGCREWGAAAGRGCRAPHSSRAGPRRTD